jgi:hypothetical protein
VIGVAGHLALQNGAIALRCPPFAKGVQDRAEKSRHSSSNGRDMEASLPGAKHASRAATVVGARFEQLHSHEDVSRTTNRPTMI